MKNWFVTGEGVLKPRWATAFGESAMAVPALTFADVGPGDIVWLLASDASWESNVAKALAYQASIVVMSYAPRDSEALRALDLGARGYVHTLAAPEVLKQVALVVSHQGVWVGQELLAKVLGGSFRALGAARASTVESPSPHLAQLTERERSVALAVAKGATNKEVARQLDITERTVKAHLSAVFRKLEVRDRLQLMLKLSS